MRWFLLLICVGLTLGADDPVVDDWLVGSLCSDGPDNWINNPSDPKAPPPCTTKEEPDMSRAGLNLTPRGDDNSCTTSEGKEGACVKPTLCDEKLKPRDTKVLFKYREADCKQFMLQCCPLEKIRQRRRPTKTLPKMECGWSNPGGYNLRSTDPKEGFSDFGDFPWMVALLKRSDVIDWNKDDYIGGGTLINPSAVLTVAHKLLNRDPSTIKCRAGEWDTRSTLEILPHQDRNVRKIILHEQFNIITADYDAALLIMETPFILAGQRHIGVGCLARDMPAPGTLCYSMGWGRSLENLDAKINSALLKKIKLPIVDSNTCQTQLRKTTLGSDYTLPDTVICAGGEEGKDTCMGDGGAPLVCEVKASGSLLRYQVYGMVVFGVYDECGKKDVPGGYAKVPVMLDWINRKMAEEKLNQTYII
ncbi:phenoloxidase-activating factor 2-like [Epargyreus clarus]|uniref:phenoloxidase-activating factor 2-like n=1 Tax=Epargyreus clarus TaxID=520877 RepID=UPI003C2E25BA